MVAVLRAAGVLVASVPNEAGRGKHCFHMLGLLPGMPDLLIFSPAPNRPELRGVAVEMKRAKGGRVSPAQKRAHALLRACGWEVRVCRGAVEAFKFLGEMGYRVPVHFSSCEQITEDVG